ncbi:MAG: KUP/HAK/KT family potassium transporter, partial [Tannerellaceae bacterium]
MKLMPLKGAKTTDLSLYGIILTLGVVFGDLGTSPLYTMQGILNATNKVDENFVLGALSCVFWT